MAKGRDTGQQGGDPTDRVSAQSKHGERQREGAKAGTRPPWVGLAASVWVQKAAGNAYTFLLFSPAALKLVLGFDQRHLATLAVANDVGENFGVVIAGVLCNSLPPWLVLLIGAAFCFLGFGAFWLAVAGTVLACPAGWEAIGTNSNAWFVMAMLVTNMRWLLLFGYFIGVGIGVTVLNNLAVRTE